ncbi:MAG: V-type ATP synthase subunit D [Candidatus Omnitrophica bacterium]|nr:V-type ATP synthase subunit D [Candidatus Omnitrophota bacterium]
MKIRVSPTRMELLKIRKRLTLARRGYKLLKEKEEQLLVEFRRLLANLREIREQVERDFLDFCSRLLWWRTGIDTASWERLSQAPLAQVQTKFFQERVLNVPVKRLEFTIEPQTLSFPQDNPMTLSLLKEATEMLSEISKLANLESQLIAFSHEIERTRRRVNALEFVLIPELQHASKFITFKLAEAERSALLRLKHLRRPNWH